MPIALLSVSDKTGVIEFARGLHNLGWQLLASGNTAKTLRENSLPVIDVADYTKSPEMLGGRVKTLHPAIHGGILARNTNSDQEELKKLALDFIDLVAVNLYPFELTIAKKDVDFNEAIENIDIGGVALIRAAAKNHERVTLVCDPADYSAVLKKLNNNSMTTEERKKLAIKGFSITSHYDSAILNFLSDTQTTTLTLFPQQSLRYGENPHQSAMLYSEKPNSGPLGGILLQGKELSYNNLLDLDAAWKTVLLFEKPTLCIVKHVSPCGIASNDNLVKAYKAALACDPISAFGGIIACNKTFTGALAEALDKLFVECIVAPHFDEAARAILATRPNCRLLEISDLKMDSSLEWRSIHQGLLQQTADIGDPKNTEWKVVSKRQPTPAEQESLAFAWKTCLPVRSNAIVLAQGTATVGIGGGQPNRIDCVRMAAERAKEKVKGAVMASDAFFPFTDVVELAATLGITAIIHPGGSIRDAEVIATADMHGIAMVMTGVRHFRH